MNEKLHLFPKALVWALAFAASAVWSESAQAQSAERVEMRPGDFGDEAWFLESFVAETWEDDPPDNYIRDQDVLVGRFDLNDDGSEEIFLVIESSYYCGSIGCPSIVLKRDGNTWIKISDGHHGGWVLTERVCGYRSLGSRDGVERWNGKKYQFAYCYPHENQCRSLAIEYDLLHNPLLQWLNPRNGLLDPVNCPRSGATSTPASGTRAATADLAIEDIWDRVSLKQGPLYPPGTVLDLLPGRYGADTPFIEKVVAEAFEPDPPPERYSRTRNIHTGRIDLNADGTDELFIANYHGDACKSDRPVDGCPFLLFQREGGGWREIGKGWLRYAVFLLDETLDGYRSIRGSGESYRWNGDRYEAGPWR